MRRRDFILLVGGAATWPLAARTQQADRARRIGVLTSLSMDDPASQGRFTTLQQGLQRLGWTESRSVQIDWRWGAGNADNVRQYAAELAALAPDVIVANGSVAVASLLHATARCRSYSRTSPIQSARASSIVSRGQGETSRVSCCSNTA
jgi:putative tryptophan/tyrosine transport system substrate-binding protein